MKSPQKAARSGWETLQVVSDRVSRQRANFTRFCSSAASKGGESRTSLLSHEDLKPGESVYALLPPADDLHLGSCLFRAAGQHLTRCLPSSRVFPQLTSQEEHTKTPRYDSSARQAEISAHRQPSRCSVGNWESVWYDCLCRRKLLVPLPFCRMRSIMMDSSSIQKKMQLAGLHILGCGI